MKEPMKDTADLLAGTSIIGVYLELLPHIAAMLAIIWTAIRIYEWARVAIFKHKTR